MNNTDPYISVIVPVHNGSGYIEECLGALQRSLCGSFETILVDDASTDDSREICEGFGVKVVALERQSGPGGARNEGAKHAAGEILLFIDSDVVVTENTLGQFADIFKNDPDISAVFGSYDDSPRADDFISQYRNLLHHFVHQRSGTEANTFWAGCGAVRRSVFTELGGFDAERFPLPSIEDIELGYRMRQKGYGIMLAKDIQVKHLKHWEWLSVLRTDIFNRAVPWSKLILETKTMPRDMNLRMTDRVSTALTGLLFISVLILVLELIGVLRMVPFARIAFLALIISAALLILNRDVYGFFIRKRGLGFTLLAIPMHLFYYLYSGVSFAVCWIKKKIWN
ncbi:MAG TPA: glycosyltransferase [Thermodesulfobacteriota bacterium]|nr:glycosyltransferase [Thermodesulfobacteriota bacterium]